MSEWIVPAVVVTVLVLVLLVGAGSLLMRRYLLTRGPGTFDCSVRRHTHGAWSYGLARYEPDRLDWFRLFALTLRPQQSLTRARLTILDRRRPTGSDSSLLNPGWLLVRCDYEATTIELAMSEPAYNGLATWLESAPPGEHVNIA